MLFQWEKSRSFRFIKFSTIFVIKKERIKGSETIKNKAIRERIPYFNIFFDSKCIILPLWLYKSVFSSLQCKSLKDKALKFLL